MCDHSYGVSATHSTSLNKPPRSQKFDELFVSPSGHWFDFDGSRKRSVLPEL